MTGRFWSAAAGQLIAIFFTTAAAQAPGPDLRLVVDVSAAMSSADPDGLRAEAVGMLLRLLPDNAYGGVWTYAGQVNMLVAHGRATPPWRKSALESTLSLPARGAGANLPAAVAAATWDAGANDVRQRHLVVISDGRLQVAGNEAEAASAWSDLHGKEARRLRAAGIRVHTLALGGRDSGGLEELSMATDGHFQRLRSLADLAGAVQTLLDAVGQPAQLLEPGAQSFLVEPGAGEVSVLWLPGPGMPASEGLILTDPAGKRYTRRTPNISFRWHSTGSYELVTFREPLAGRWHFAAPTGAVTGVYAISDLKLSLAGLPAMVFPGDVKVVTAAVVDGAGEPLDGDFVDLLELEADVDAGGSPERLPVRRSASGFTVKMLAGEVQGPYAMRLALRGPTFERHLSVPFTVRNPLALELLPADTGAVAWLGVSAGDLVPAATVVRGLITRPMQGVTTVPAERYPGGIWKVPVDGPPGLLELVLEITGKRLNGEDFSMKTQPVVVSLPVSVAKQINFDLSGVEISRETSPGTGPSASGPTPGQSAAPVASALAPGTLQRPAEPALPLWFALVLALLNLLAGGGAYFLVRPPSPAERFFAGLDELRDTLGSDRAAQPA